MAMAEGAARQSAASTTQGADYIAGLVSAGDQDRYWAGLLMPRPARDHLFALYAFNIELARIGEQVREPQLGEIRLQWWHDALAPGAAASGHPVADGVIAARGACDLPSDWLGAMIDARILDVQRASIASMEELEAYLIATAGMVFRLGAWIAGGRDEASAIASREAALAWGLTGLMRALPLHVRRGQLYLPADFLSAFGVDAAAVTAGEDSPGLRAALGVLRERAGAHLANFRGAAKALPAAALPVFLPLALVSPYLRKLADPTHRPLADIAQLNPLSRFARIWLANLRGRV
jgi:15-cis-phytoene synthase